jgi:hypothetical protein
VNTLLKPDRLPLLFALWFALGAAACGGGGGTTVTPPPPVGGFSNANLKGQYAFSMNGQNGATGAFFARVGSFTADGNGNITGGLEDVNVTGVNETLAFTPSTYSISADGRGIINLINQTGQISFSVTMISPTQGLLAETDLTASASGTFLLQNSSNFSASGFNGDYVFDFLGLDPGGAPDSIVGQFQANGGGSLSGVLDENDNAVPSGAQPFTSGSYQMDSTNGPTTGRGAATFVANGILYNYIFYIVNGSKVRFMENSSTGALTVGDASIQSSVPTTAATFNGGFVFSLSGNGTSGPITRIGRVTASGSGGLTQIFADNNDAGTVTQVPKGSLSATTYTIDGNFPGSGRGTLTYTDSSLGVYSYVFYLSSASGGVIQDVSINNGKGNVGDGTIQLQTGSPFSASTMAGDYAANFSGVSSNSSTQVTAEEDYVGHLNFASSGANGNVSGALDFSEFSSNQGAFFNIVVTGNGLTIGGDGSTSTGTRNALQLKLASNPSSTLNFVPYIIDSQHMVVAGTDTNRVISGVVTLQAP